MTERTAGTVPGRAEHEAALRLVAKPRPRCARKLAAGCQRVGPAPEPRPRWFVRACIHHAATSPPPRMPSLPADALAFSDGPDNKHWLMRFPGMPVMRWLRHGSAMSVASLKLRTTLSGI